MSLTHFLLSRGTFLAATTLGFVLAACVGVPQARAQFVCGGSVTGNAPQVSGGASATGAGAVACGTVAIASGDVSSAFGDFSTASGLGSVAIGTGFLDGGGGNNIAGATNTNATASGFQARASGDNSSAYGSNSTASGLQSSAFGTNSTASGDFSSAFGTFATAGFSNSAAFGEGATASRANQQVFGSAFNTYTMPGITSAASKAAQSGTLQIVTSDAGGNLATSPLASLGLASSTDVSAINARLDDLTTRSNKAYTGIAMAFAMAGVPTVLPNEKFAMTVNWGTFEGANGLALNAAARITDNVQFNAGIGYGPNERIAGGRAGLRFGW